MHRAWKKRWSQEFLAESHPGWNHLLELQHFVIQQSCGGQRAAKEGSSGHAHSKGASCGVQQLSRAAGWIQPGAAGAALFPHPTRGWVLVGQARLGLELCPAWQGHSGSRALIYHLTRVAGLPGLALGTSLNIQLGDGCWSFPSLLQNQEMLWVFIIWENQLSFFS